MKPDAIIFDMDDTLVHSSPIWKAAETRLLQMMGADWSPTLSAKYKGMNALDVARVMHDETKSAMPLAECQQILRENLIEGFRAGVAAMPGAVEIVERLRGRYPLAVASGSPLAAIQLALSHVGILDAFDHVITSEDVPRGKPHPDVFLREAELLGKFPTRCLVFEDSVIGCQAARAAGMWCFVVPSVPVELVQSIATRIFKSLADIGDDDFDV